MATQYEIEHNIKPNEQRKGRHLDMSSFYSRLNELHSPAGTTNTSSHHNTHATPTPVDEASLFRLLQDQFQTLHTTSPDASNREFLESLISQLDTDIDEPKFRGVSQQFVDSIDRVPRKTLKADDDCAICKIPYLDDEYCLVVELPCKGGHRFDLECVAPWLMSKGTCPMCREEMEKKKEVPAKAPVIEEDDESDQDMMYA